MQPCTIAPSNPRKNQSPIVKRPRQWKPWKKLPRSTPTLTTQTSMARNLGAVTPRTNRSVATRTQRPGSSHTSTSSPQHLGSPTMYLVVFTCSVKLAMCVHCVYAFKTSHTCIWHTNFSTRMYPIDALGIWCEHIILIMNLYSVLGRHRRQNWRPSGVDL